MKKEVKNAHKLLALLPALTYHLKEAEKIRQEVAKLKLKDLRK